MSEPQKAVSWWQTLPGVLTALAAFITAISGLIGLLYQNGLLGHQADPLPSQAQAASSTASGASVHATPASASAQSRKPWSEVTAVVLGRDGSKTRVRGDSLCNCISVNHELALENGQSGPFERMSSLEVLQADDHTSSNAKAHIRIELLDGSTIASTVEANCDLFGFNDLGRFSTYYDQIRQVQFER